MWFSAVFVCVRCGLRQPERAHCIECKGRLLSLRREHGRHWFRVAAKRSTARFEWVHAIADRASNRPWRPYALGLALLAPTGLHLSKGEPAADLSLTFVALAALGVLVGAFAAVTHLARAWTERPAARTTPRMRVLTRSAAAPTRTVLRGVARLATSEISAALSGTRCLAFGVRGQVGNVDVADADGGDFDLELADGERVAVSLEHGLLQPGEASPRELPARLPQALSDLLESRGIESEGRSVRLAETSLCDGDEVEVEGQLGGALVALGYRGRTPTRVIEGRAEAPVRVRILVSAARDDEEAEEETESEEDAAPGTEIVRVS